MPPVRSVLISGAGIAGPTLAYWLLAHGFQPTLVERAPRLRTGGYVVDFWGKGFDLAERMGLGDDLQRLGYRVEEVRLVDGKGRRVGGFRTDVLRSILDDRFISVRRSDLSRLIYRKIETRCEAIFADSIDGIEQRGDGVHVRFARGAPRTFDIVVGADGLHSQVRGLAMAPQDSVERYLGYTVAAFEVDGYRPRDELVYVSYGLPGRQISRFAMRGDRTLFLLVFAAEAGEVPDIHAADAHKAALHRVFGGGGWECPQILAEMDRSEEIYFDRVSQIRMNAWSRGRVALAGDAAFCPSLLAGQGTALAMVAAYVLAVELAKASDRPGEAFARYEARLHPFISGKQQAAARFASSFAPRTRFGLFVRNQVTKLFGLPRVANLVIGRSLRDSVELPDDRRVERTAA